MFLGFFAWYRGLALGGVARIGQIQLVQPVLTLGWSAVLLGEQVTRPTVLAALLVIGSAALSQRSRLVGVGRSPARVEHLAGAAAPSVPGGTASCVSGWRTQDMPERVDERRRELYGLLGDLPERDRPLHAETIAEEERDGYILEKLLLDLNGIEPVPAYFVRPRNATGRLPVVLYHHAHGGDYLPGKDELLDGRTVLQSPSYAMALTRRGYAALAIDFWLFGERRGRTESEVFKEMLWQGQVLWGMMVYDSLRAVDYLVTRDDVDANRIATCGLSMGSTMAWWLAALDERIKVCIDLCCLTDFQTLVEMRGLDGHGVYYFVPRLLKQFSTADINSLIAPRPHLSLAGVFDRLTPPAGLDRVDTALRRVYADAGAPEAWQLRRSNSGHFETAAMRAQVFAFLARWL